MTEYQDFTFRIGDRVSCKIHRYLTNVWTDCPTPTEKRCNGVIVRQMHNSMFLIRDDMGKLFACSIGFIYKII